MVEETQKVQDTQLEEGALKTVKPTFYRVISIIVGANIDPEVLGLAYSTRLAGWPVLLLWLVVTDLFTTFSVFYAVEAAPHICKPLQLPGLAEKYMGESGSFLVFTSMCASPIGCMIVYTTSSGNIIRTLLGLPNWANSLLFTALRVLVVWLGLKTTGIWERFISIGTVPLLVLIAGASSILGKADASRAIYTNWTYAVPTLSTAIFCYIVQYIVPELARGIRHTSEELPGAIMIGMSTIGILLALVPLAVLSLTGADEVTQVTTIAWGQALGAWALLIANIFTLCAMITSYWTVDGAMLTNIVDMFKLRDERETKTHLIVIACTALPPSIPTYSGSVSFVDAIDWAGTFNGMIVSIVPVKMLQSARRNDDIEPEWQCDWYAKKPIQYTVITIFLLGAVYYICSMFGILSTGW